MAERTAADVITVDGDCLTINHARTPIRDVRGMRYVGTSAAVVVFLVALWIVVAGLSVALWVAAASDREPGPLRWLTLVPVLCLGVAAMVCWRAAGRHCVILIKSPRDSITARVADRAEADRLMGELAGRGVLHVPEEGGGWGWWWFWLFVLEMFT